MPRTDRVFRLADLLRAHGEQVTVASLANTLGVSERTVFRDLALLRDRGLPLAATAGRGGGVRLLGGRGVTAVHLALDEVVSLWLAARIAGAVAELPWSRHAAGALQKLLLSLPPARAAELRSLCTRIFTGPPPTTSMQRNVGRPLPGLLHLFEQASARGVGLAFEYVGLHAPPLHRRVEPHGLLVQAPLWYLLARDHDHGKARMFRMDRIRHPFLLPSVRFAPSAEVARSLLHSGFEWRPLLPAMTRSTLRHQ